MQLQNFFASRFLMQTVNILCDDCRQFALLFQTSKSQMSRIWFCIRVNHFIKVEIVKLLRIAHKEGMTQHDFRRETIFFLLIDPFVTAEIGDIGLSADTCPTKEHDPLAVFDDLS